MTHENLDERGGPPAVDPLMSAVRALGDVMDRFDDAAARALGIARSDLRALNMLEHGPVAAGEVATALGLSTSSVTALVDRLVKAGYVTREAVPDDRRKVMVRLEPATYAAFARVYAPCGRAVGAITSRVPAPDVERTRHLIDEVVAAIGAEGAKLRDAGA